MDGLSGIILKYTAESSSLSMSCLRYGKNFGGEGTEKEVLGRLLELSILRNTKARWARHEQHEDQRR